METLLVELSLNIWRVTSKEIGHSKGLKVSLILADLHPDKILLFLGVKQAVKNVKSVSKILEPK